MDFSYYYDSITKRRFETWLKLFMFWTSKIPIRICASLSYAYLKQALGNENVVACRLGTINKETKYVLDYFNVEPPKLIKSVKPQVSDLHFNNFSMATEQIRY